MKSLTRAYRPDRPSVPELAAGAVLLLEGTQETLLLHHAAELRWCMPKGHVEAGESLATAALREVREETGIQSVSLDREIAEVRYRFYNPKKDRNVFKTTVYWLARTRERAANPEELFDDARWVSLAKAAAMLPYPDERRLVRGLARIGRPSQGPSRLPHAKK